MTYFYYRHVVNGKPIHLRVFNQLYQSGFDHIYIAQNMKTKKLEQINCTKINKRIYTTGLGFALVRLKDWLSERGEPSTPR